MNAGSLSVIMANYNHAHYIGEALQAILSQSLRPKEIIIVDDASTDDSVAVIEQFVKRDPIIHFIRNDQNRGPLFSHNRALDIASSDYVYFPAADDRVLPGLFEKSMNILAQYPQAGLCCSDPASFTDHVDVISENRLYFNDRPCYFSPAELVGLMRWKHAAVAGHTSVIKRSALLQAGNWIQELKWHCDWFALLVIGFRYGICYIPEPLATIRVLPHSYSSSGIRQWPAQREVLDHLLRLLKSPAYRDVLPLFKRSNALAAPSKMGVVLLSNPKHWDYLSLPIIQRSLWPELRLRLARISPSPVKLVYRCIRDIRRRTLRGSRSL